MGTQVAGEWREGRVGVLWGGGQLLPLLNFSKISTPQNRAAADAPCVLRTVDDNEFRLLLYPMPTSKREKPTPLTASVHDVVSNNTVVPRRPSIGTAVPKKLRTACSSRK